MALIPFERIRDDASISGVLYQFRTLGAADQHESERTSEA